MRFHVGPWVYTTLISQDALWSTEGRELLGKVDFESRLILLSPVVQPDKRLDILLHEIRHAYAHHHPKPRTEEEECNFFSTIFAQVRKDLAEQGGEIALVRMEPCQLPPLEPEPERVIVTEEEEWRLTPPEYVHPNESVAESHGERVQCGVCCLTIAGGSVITSEPRWSDRSAGTVCDRTVYCPHCHHLQDWVEGFDRVKNRPSGAVVGEPSYRKGRVVELFLEEHREAEGLLVV